MAPSSLLWGWSPRWEVWQPSTTMVGVPPASWSHKNTTQLLSFTTITMQRPYGERCWELAASPPTVIVGAKPTIWHIETPLGIFPVKSDKTNFWNVGERSWFYWNTWQVCWVPIWANKICLKLGGGKQTPLVVMVCMLESKTLGSRSTSHLCF